MTSAFSFGFSGDDIDEEESGLDTFAAGGEPVDEQFAQAALPRLLEPEKHDMREWVSRSWYCFSVSLSM